MNASNMPDKTRPEEWFRDYQFTSHAIKALKELSTRVHATTGQPQKFAVSLGFKLPHLAVHVPWKYYEMYRSRQNAFMLSKKELRFPLGTPEVSFRIGERYFTYMKNEGQEKSEHVEAIGKIDQVIPAQMRPEMQWTYSAAVSFLDTQVGRLLDTMDELGLWDNTTVILTADHGMHNVPDK